MADEEVSKPVQQVSALKDFVFDATMFLGDALGQAADRLIPQGRDELCNALFNGSAYWPGEHPEVMPVEPPAAPVVSHDIGMDI